MKYLSSSDIRGVRNVRLAKAIDRQLAKRKKPTKSFGDILEEGGMKIHDLDPVAPKKLPPSQKEKNMQEYEKKGKKIYPYWRVPEWRTA